MWGDHVFIEERTVDVHIRRLRSKLEMCGCPYISTVRNVGYRLRELTEAERALFRQLLKISGIGARTAELFVEEGAKMVIAGRRQAEGEEAVQGRFIQRMAAAFRR